MSRSAAFDIMLDVLFFVVLATLAITKLLVRIHVGTP